MQRSIRSPLIAGTAAIVGAGAIAMTPVVAQPDLRLPAIQLPSASSAEVALAGFDSPISELLVTLGVVNTYLFGQTGEWQTGTGWSNLSQLGVVPQIITDHLPIISQLGLNGSDYLYQTGRGLGKSAYLLSEGVWNAVGDLLTLDIPGAFNTLVTAVQQAGQTALATGTYVLTGVVARAGAVLTAVADLIPNIADAFVKQVNAVIGSVVKVVTDTVAALKGPKPFENAWNAVVDGLFGSGTIDTPSGIPGTFLATTIGYGIYGTPYVPSVRVVLTTVVDHVQQALANTPNPAPPPVAAKPVVAKSVAATSAADLRAAAAVDPTPAVEAGTNENTADNGATAGGNADDKGGSSAGGSSKGGANHRAGTGASKRAHSAASNSAE